MPKYGMEIGSYTSKKTFASGSIHRTNPRQAAELESGSEIKSSSTSRGNQPSELEALIDEFVSTTRRPASSPQAPRYRNFTDRGYNQGNSATDVLSAMTESRSSRNRMDMSEMLTPLPKPSSQASVSEKVHSGMKVSSPPVPRMRLGPSAGRSVAVEPDRGNDVGRTFRLLEIHCARNQVKNDFMRQRFHERPGLKRKRLYSTRWRKLFMEGFKAMASKVDHMRRQGW